MSQQEARERDQSYADLRVIAHDLRVVQTTTAGIAEKLETVVNGVNVLTGQLSVRCPAEEERLSRLERTVDGLRTWMLATLATALLGVLGVVVGFLLRR